MHSPSRSSIDPLLTAIADYVTQPPPFNDEAETTAAHCLLDSLACALLALHDPTCARQLGPALPGGTFPLGARVPGTQYALDPASAAFATGCCIGWLDAHDSWLAEEWTHPADSLGALLPVADWLSRNLRHPHQLQAFGRPLPLAHAEVPEITVRDLLQALIKAYEIHGILAIDHAFHPVGLDHVLLVRVAASAVVTHLLGGDRDRVIAALSHAWLDGSALCLYRQAPHQGIRHAWAAGDAASRAVQLALRALSGEPAYPDVLSAPHGGFEATCFQNGSVTLVRPLGCHVMDHVLFRLPAGMAPHAQTALEAAARLHPAVVDRWSEIARIEVATCAASLVQPDPPEWLSTPAGRHRSRRYLTAVGLVQGPLAAATAEDTGLLPEAEALLSRIHVHEDPGYTADYLDPEKRALAHAVQVFFRDGSHTERSVWEYPLGHRRRRPEALPALFAKAEAALHARFDDERAEEILDLFDEPATLAAMPVARFLDLFVP